MATLNELTADTIRQLYGYAQIRPRRMSLAEAITATDSEIPLTDKPGSNRAVFEVDEEIIYVQSYLDSTGVATCESWGRGFDGTVPQAHDKGAMVTMDPQWTTKVVRDELVTQIQTIYPDLWAWRSFSVIAPASGEGIPAIGKVTDVFTDKPGETPRRLRSFDANDGALFVRGADVGEPLRVYCMAPPDIPQPNEDVALSSGLPRGIEQALQYGAMAKFIGGVTAALTQSNSVEQADREDHVSISSTNALVRTLLQQRAMEVQRVRDLLFATRPMRAHKN